MAITIAFANTYGTTPTEGAKRRYSAHFLSKLTDSDGELQESLHWLETAKECGYVGIDEADELVQLASQVGRQLGSMINRHESFCF